MKYHKKKKKQTPIMLQLFSALWNEATDNEHKNTNVHLLQVCLGNTDT